MAFVNGKPVRDKAAEGRAEGRPSVGGSKPPEQYVLEEAVASGEQLVRYARRFTRPTDRLAPPQWGLGCCAFTEDCRDGYFLHAGHVTGEAGSVKMSSGRVMGFVNQPKYTRGGPTKAKTH